MNGFEPAYDSDSDWENAFDEAGIRIDDIATVARRTTGQNDEADWLATGTLLDGRAFSMRAGCDYTGWGCQQWGEAGFYSEGQDPLGFFSVDEQVRLDRDGQPGFWPGAFCDTHEECRAHVDVARQCQADQRRAATEES